MTIHASVYPPAVADKCVALLCERQQGLRPAPSSLTAARFLMMHGYVEQPSRKSACFAVLSPDTPRFYYAVDLRAESCTCADFLRTQRPCKHIGAVVLALLAQRRFGFTPQTVPAKARAQ